MARVGFFLIFLFSVSGALAQLDPSSTLLLNGGSDRKPPTASGLDSGRYTVRPKAPSQERPRPALPEEPSRQVVTDGDVSSQEGDDTQPDDSQTANPREVTPESTGEASTESVQTQVRDILLGGPIDKIQRYRHIIHPEDGRLNVMEISLAPTFIYNDSNSSFWYRDYSAAGPAFAANVKVWFTPFFAVNADYVSTLGGHLKSSLDQAAYISATHQWFRFGIRTRRFFGLSRSSPSLSVGVDYREYQLGVPADSTMRARLKTTGIALSLEAEAPSSINHSWLFGFEIGPRAKHQEIATVLDLKSGATNQTHLIGASIGGKLKFSRKSVIFWKLAHTFEKSLFTGNANTVDPLTGITPQGVPVSNSFTLIQTGFTWGH